MYFVVTGCSSGLGFHLVNTLLNKEKNVIGVSRTLGRCSIFLENKNFKFIAMDLVDTSKIHETLAKHSLNELDDVQLILNAGVFFNENINSTFNQKTYDIFAVNYFSCIDFVSFFMKNNLRRVLFVNSVAGINSFGGQSQYCASKHAQLSFSRSLQKESIGKNFDVMTINPGGINTELWDKNTMLKKNQTQKFLDPSDLAIFLGAILELPPNTYLDSCVILPEADI